MVHNDIVPIRGKLCIYSLKYFPKVISFIAVGFDPYVFCFYEIGRAEVIAGNSLAYIAFNHQ